jgi:uncharacterized protein (TIGR02448 family)
MLAGYCRGSRAATKIENVSAGTVSLQPSRRPAAYLGNGMKLRSVSLSLALLAATGPAIASSFAGTTAGSGSEASSDSTSDSTGSTSGDDKIVLEAREDAAGFVASDGRIRSARLEAALAHLRQSNERARVASDMQLARLILTL